MIGIERLLHVLRNADMMLTANYIIQEPKREHEGLH